jgi:hypothetical protein
MPACCQIDSRGAGSGETRRNREILAAGPSTARQIDGGNGGYCRSGKQGNRSRSFQPAPDRSVLFALWLSPGYENPGLPAAPVQKPG